MNSKEKKSIFLFGIYKFFILISLIIQFFCPYLEMIVEIFALFSIFSLVIAYWYVIINVFCGADKKYEKMSLFDKIVAVCNLILKTTEYYIVYYIVNTESKVYHFLIVMGILLIDCFLESKLCSIIINLKNKGLKAIKHKEKKYMYSESEKKQLFWLYIISLGYIFASFIQMFRVIVGYEVQVEFIVKYAIFFYLLDRFVKTSTNRKKEYIKGINYLINVLVLIIESGLYWILYDKERGVHFKIIATICSLLCFEIFLAGQYGKKYNEAINCEEN